MKNLMMGNPKCVGLRKSHYNNQKIFNMKKVILNLALVFCIGAIANAQTGNNVIVGGQEMLPQKNIIENALNSGDHTTLVAAVKAADLVSTLSGIGPFTVFAPVNDAFENLPSGTVQSLLKPENKKSLQGVLTYHVISGKYDFNALSAEIKKGKGSAILTTVNGATLTFMMNGLKNITVKDKKGSIANISVYDVYQSNGVIHVIDKVLLP